MTIEVGLVAHLEADAAVAALVVARIYPVLLPQNVTYPAISYERVNTDRRYSFDGPSIHIWPFFRIHCWSQSYLQAKSLGEAVRKSLNGFTGTMGTDSVINVEMQNENDLYEPDVDVHRVILDFVIPTTEALS